MLKDAQLLRQFENGGCGFDFLSRHRQLGRVSILREGLERAAWLSVYGSGEQRRLAAEFVSYIPQRAEEAGKEVYEKATKIVEEGMSRAGRYGKLNAAIGRAYARADAPGGREADAKRFSALVKALTGEEPRVYRMKDGKIIIECYEGHLEGFAHYAELADAIEKWLEETSRRTPPTGRGLKGE